MNKEIRELRSIIVSHLSKDLKTRIYLLELSDHDLIEYALRSGWIPPKEYISTVVMIMNNSGDDVIDNRIRRCTWNEFRDTGLMWLTNMILNVFGWAIVVDGKSGEVFPARVSYRGFTEKTNDVGYTMIASYLKDMSEELYREIKESE